MKVKLKAFIIIYPDEPYPSAENIKIGGVASSAQHELANENGGIVVPLSGEYDTNDLIQVLQDRIDDNNQIIQELSKKGSVRDLKEATQKAEFNEVLKSQIDKIKSMKLEDLTNLAHIK